MKLEILPLILTVGMLVTSSQVASAQRELPPEPVPTKETVEPGESHTNGDGVQVQNTSRRDSGDNFCMNPKTGNANSATTVDMDNNAIGSVSGIDWNDTVNVSNGTNVTISGTGGTVNLSNASGSQGSITNTNPAGGGGQSIRITGAPVPIYVPPGQTVTFSYQ